MGFWTLLCNIDGACRKERLHAMHDEVFYGNAEMIDPSKQSHVASRQRQKRIVLGRFGFHEQARGFRAGSPRRRGTRRRNEG